MKSKLLALVLGAAAFAASAAPTFSFKNVPAGWDGTFQIKLNGFESFTDGLNPGSINYGVLKITSIVTADGNGTVLWADGDNGAEITGVFNSITVTALIPNGVGGGTLLATGGLANFYINNVGSYAAAGGGAQGSTGYSDAGCAINTLCYDGISNVAGGALLLSTQYVPGISLINPAATVSGSVNGTSLPVTGHADGYLAVTGGSEQARFDTNGFLGGTADLFAQNNFCPVGAAACVSAAGGGDWQLAIDDPVRGAAKLPEPASLALVGLGLLGAGMARRRKSA